MTRPAAASPWFFLAACLAVFAGCDSPGQPGDGTAPTTAPPSVPPPPAPLPSGTGGAAPAAATSGPQDSEPWQVRPGQWMAHIRAEDPARVDLVDLLPQVEALAARIEPRAKLVQIHAAEVVSGTVDTTKAGAATYAFEHEGLDESQPPGRDAKEIALTVSVGGSQLWAFPHGGARLLRSELGGMGLVTPCSSRKAWASAVGDGMPVDAVASFDYGSALAWDAPRERGRPAKRREWSLRVKGHGELKRSLDPVTCEPFRKPTEVGTKRSPARAPPPWAKWKKKPDSKAP